MGQYGASGQNREEGRGRIAHGLATTKLRGHSKGFCDDSETERDRDVTNRSFPHQRYKLSRTVGLLRPRLRMPYRRP